MREQAASLRNIVKTAGVTTGAFYGYYKSKEEAKEYIWQLQQFHTAGWEELLGVKFGEQS